MLPEFYDQLVAIKFGYHLDVEVYLEDVLNQVLAGSTEYEAMLPDRWNALIPNAFAPTAHKSAATKPTRPTQGRLPPKHPAREAPKLRRPAVGNGSPILVLLDAYVEPVKSQD